MPQKKRDISMIGVAKAKVLNKRISAYVLAGVPLPKAYDAVMGSGAYKRVENELNDALEQAARF